MRHALLHLALLLLCPHLSFPAPDATAPPCANLSAFDIGHGNATFARVEGVPDPQRWRAAACPVEMTSTSCYWHNRSRAAELEHRPLPGVCRPFRMEEFLELIRCRGWGLAAGLNCCGVVVFLSLCLCVCIVFCRCVFFCFVLGLAGLPHRPAGVPFAVQLPSQ
eukprot:EG_transcript_36804